MDIRRTCLIAWFAIQCAANGATWNPPDPQATTVQQFIDLASDGDVVQLPAGSAIWSTQVVVSNKAVTVLGPGTNLLTITHGMTINQPCLKLLNLGGKQARISAIRFVVTNSAMTSFGTIGVSALGLNNFCSNWRIDHLLIEEFGRGIETQGRCEGGVVDHCEFRHTRNIGQQALTFFGPGQYPLVPGNTSASFPAGSSWTTTASPGSNDAIFVEDCFLNYQFPGDSGMEGYYGAKFVSRYNTAWNATVAGGHGLDSSVSSTHMFECYSNTIVSTAWSQGDTVPGFNGNVVAQRGGTGVIFGNRYLVPWLVGPDAAHFGGSGIAFWCYRASGEQVIKNYQGGFVTGDNPFDWNQPGTVGINGGITPTGWPTLEQIGTTGPVTLFSDHSEFTLAPVYIWDNTYGPDLNTQTNSMSIGVQDYPPNQKLKFSGSDLVIDASNNKRVRSATHKFYILSGSAFMQLADEAFALQQTISVDAGKNLGLGQILISGYLKYTNTHTANLFVPTNSFTLGRVTVRLIKMGTGGPGTVRAKLYADNGSGRPGALLETSGTSVPGSSVPTSAVDYQFPFSTAVTSGQQYWVDFHYDGTAGTANYIGIRGEPETLKSDTTPVVGTHLVSVEGTVWQIPRLFGTSNGARKANSIDSYLEITSGTGFTPGWYRITNAIAGDAFVDRAIGTVGSTGGVWRENWSGIIPGDIIKSGRDYITSAKPGYTPYTYPHPLVSGEPPPPPPPPPPSPPAAPSNLHVVVIGSTQLNIDWTDNSTNETGFNIERSFSASSGFTEISQVGAGVTNFPNINLSPSTTYYYRVRAFNSGGNSSYTTSVPGTTDATTEPPVPAVRVGRKLAVFPKLRTGL